MYVFKEGERKRFDFLSVYEYEEAVGKKHKLKPGWFFFLSFLS